MARDEPMHIGYCLTHGREFPVIQLGYGTKLAEAVYIHPVNGEKDIDPSQGCRGPFAYCPPPPPLTEDEWELILDKEYYRYAN
jgi:hypothetical protein